MCRRAAEPKPRRPAHIVLGQKVIVQIGGKIVSGRGTATERLPIPDLLNVAQAAGDALVAVGVEGVEVNGHTGVAAGIDLSPVQNGLDGLVHDLGGGGAVGVDEVGTLVRLVIPLGVAVPEGELQCAFGRHLPSELCHTLLDGSVHSGVDGGDGLGVALEDDEADGILGVAAVDGGRLPDIGVGQPDNAGDHLGVGFLSGHGLVLLKFSEVIARTGIGQGGAFVGFGNEGRTALGLLHQGAEDAVELLLGHQLLHLGDGDEGFLEDVGVPSLLAGFSWPFSDFCRNCGSL